MDELQFYPTPRWLADRAWNMFSDREFTRVLDPSAGEGALAQAAPRDYYDRAPKVDVIEIDASKHPILREHGLRVVGLDFLGFEGGHCYTHVVMNPPFAAGAKHVLKAWDMLWEGEIVAILNAQTLRNPFSAERKRLLQLVEDHGSVEYIADAFKGEEVVREADVEIALVHLVKPAECTEDWIGPVIESMRVDRNKEEAFELPRELALPNSFVTNQVRAFRAAVKAMREAVRMRAVADHYAVRIGRTMDDLANNRSDGDVREVVSIRKALEEGYDNLKDRAWASVLRSTETLSKLSSKVQKQAESQFSIIQALEFSEENVYSFLLGLVQSQPEMQLDMMCEVFDLITRYWSDNTVFYRGWKSNDKHRTMGRRIKMTRFIIPYMRGWSHSLDWDSLRVLADLDKVFALLDGRSQPEVSLVSLFESKGPGNRNTFDQLRRGERLDGSYLSVRWYKGVATCHLYPRNKELVDRLNRIVGRRRGWLPPPDEQGSDAFWKQYEKAEKFDAEFRAETDKAARASRGYFHHSDSPIHQFMLEGHEGRERAEASMAAAMDTVLERHGLLPAISDERRGAMPLLLEAA